MPKNKKLSSEKEYLDAMRCMMQRVQQGDTPPLSASTEELEVLAECIRRGYLTGTVTHTDKNGVERELRTLDGKIHPILFNNVVTLAGLAFLESNAEEDRHEPDKTDNAIRNRNSREQFFKSGYFWSAVAIAVTLALWIVDRFVLGV